MNVSYASSEIIVDIIAITEKCSPGFVLRTQVTVLASACRWQGRLLGIARTCHWEYLDVTFRDRYVIAFTTDFHIVANAEPDGRAHHGAAAYLSATGPLSVECMCRGLPSWLDSFDHMRLGQASPAS